MDFDTWFDNLYIEHNEQMRKYVRRVFDDIELAEDITHSVFAVLLSKGEDMMEHPNPVGWLFLTLQNLIGNEIQRASRKSEEPLSVQFIETAVYDTYFTTELESMPEELTLEEREIIQMHFIDGKSYEEIAAYVGKSESACRTRVCRAKAKFKKYWGKEENTRNSCNKESMPINKIDRRVKDAKHS